MSPAASLPETCGVAFKEWAGICRALASGRQSIILRKGGIDEGPGGFRPEHPAFWLAPTFTHQAAQGLREEIAAAIPVPTPAEADRLEIDTFTVVTATHFLARVEQLEALRRLHVWTEETVRSRFYYRKPGLWVLGVRIYLRPTPYRIEVGPEFAGCKTWVPLNPPLATEGLVPVRDDDQAAADAERLAEALNTTWQA